MLAAIASAALLVAASLIVGRGALALCGRREPTWLAGPIGLALLLTTSAIVAGLDGRGTAIWLTLFILTLSAGGVTVWKGRGVPALPALAAAALAALFASIPFVAAGNVGILGVGLVNDDMASHLLLADWIEERFRPEPVLIDQGYPLGPHALVAGLAVLLDTSSVDVFAGLTLAIPALTALVAYSALGGLAGAARVGAAALVALPYLAAAYLAQEAFKEPIVALFLLTFALLLPTVRDWRDAIPLGVLAAGTVYVYSFPGLAWLGGVAIVWTAIRIFERRGFGGGHRAAALAIAAGMAVLLIAVAPELDRLRDFVDFRALHPDRANEGGLGNLPGQISPLEALGIWPTSDFRRSAAASSIPAIVFYAGALLAAFAFALALPRWLRRHGPAIPAALLTAAILYLIALAFGTVYTSAKALAIAAPLIILITLGGLLAKEPQMREASGPGGRRRRLRSMDARTPADMDVKPPVPAAPRSRRLPALAILATVFAAAAAFSSFLILRQAPVGPEAHAEELAEIRPLVQGEKLLFLGRDNFILHELRGSKPFTHVRNFYDPYFVEPNFDLERVGDKFDFDSVTAETLARFPFVLATRAAYASGPPPGYDPVAETDSYTLWERGGEVAGRLPGEMNAEPGRVGGCSGSAQRVATFATEPIVAPEGDWSASTVKDGEAVALELELPAGSWSLSLKYDSTRAVTLTAPGFEATLPGNLDYRGSSPFWPAGTIAVAEPGAIRIEATVEDPPLAGRLLGADSVAHLGELAASKASGHRFGSRCGGYVDWYERG